MRGKFEILAVFPFAVVPIAVGELAFQGLRDEGGGVGRLAGLGFGVACITAVIGHQNFDP